MGWISTCMDTDHYSPLQSYLPEGADAGCNILSVRSSYLFPCSILFFLILNPVCSHSQSYLFLFSILFVLNPICSHSRSYLFPCSILFVLILNPICSHSQSYLFSFSILFVPMLNPICSHSQSYLFSF